MKLIIQDRNKNRKELNWRWLAPEDMDAIRHLEDRIEEAMEDPTLYVREKEAYILTAMKIGAGCIGGFVDGQLVALRFVSYPQEYNLGEGIIAKEHLDSVLHMETMIVDPDYRGNGLQVKSFYYMLAHLPEEVKFLFSTVSPYNLPSLKSVFKYGSVMVDVRFMYSTDEEPDGVLRYVAVRGLVQELDEKKVIVPREDYQKQQAYFQKGYVATGLLNDQQVRFQKALRTVVPLCPRKERA